MLRHTKDIETLISRRLDGALSPEEALQLDRELIRNPDARRLMEEYGRIDDLAGAALRAAFAEEAATIELDDLSVARCVRSRRFRVRWLVAGSIAAALAAVFVAQSSLEPARTVPTLVDRHPVGTVGGGKPRRASPEWRLRPAAIDGKQFRRNASTPLPMRVQRDRGRETIGVLGEDGNIYWIEVDRTRTVRKAAPQVVRQWATGGV